MLFSGLRDVILYQMSLRMQRTADELNHPVEYVNGIQVVKAFGRTASSYGFVFRRR